MYLDPLVFNNTNYRLALIFLYSAVATAFAVPYVIKRCQKYGYMVKDMHKIGYPQVPVLGGAAILAGLVISLALSELLFVTEADISGLFIFYFVVFVYGMYGLLDDLFHFRNRHGKIIVLWILSLPLGSLVTGTRIDLIFTQIDPGWAYTLIIAPIYVMVVSNLINLHAGFNGMGPGTTLVMLIASGIKSYMTHGNTYLIYLMPILGAVLVFFFFNKYPSRIFDGNIGAFLMGSALGAFLIVNHLELFGILIFIPHIITFIMDTYVLVIKRVPDKEFPEPRSDGLIVPDIEMRYKSLKNTLCSWFPLTEKSASWTLIALTAIFSALGVIFG